MDVNNSTNGRDSSPSNKAKEVMSSESEHINVNGINGYSSDKHKSHKSEHKDKHRDRDKERSKEHKSSSKDKDRHSSKDKDRHHSHKSYSKDKDRDKERSDRDKSRSDRDKDRDKDRSDRDKERSDRDKDRSDRDKSKSDKDRSDRDKERSDRDKRRHRDDKKSSSSKDKDREHKSSKDKEHKSSSSYKDKDGKEKDRDKEKRDKDKERRDKDRDKDKHRHSSSKDSSSKDKHKEKDRDKDRHSSSKDKDKEKRDKEKKAEKNGDMDSDKKVKEEKYEIKQEVKYELKQETYDVKEERYDSAKEDSVDEDEQKLVIKEETDSQDETEFRNVSQASSCDYNLSQFDKNEPRFDDEDCKDESQQEYDYESQNEDKSNIKQEDVDDEEYKPKLESTLEESDEDMPLAARMDKSNQSIKRKFESDDEDDDVPLVSRKKVKKEKKEKKKKKRMDSDYEQEEDEEDYKPLKKKEKKNKEKDKKKTKIIIKQEPETVSPKKGRKKKEEEEQEVWKWWEEQKKDDGNKWNFLQHKGPVFAPPYEPLPKDVKFFYDGKEMKLSERAEEVAGFYAKMLDHDYTSKKAFNTNFFEDWRKLMTDKERSVITELKKCNFKQLHAYFMDLSEKNKNRTKEEKLALKEKNEAQVKEYGFCLIDGHKEKIGNFKIEPPGLFRGRGEHPKMGKLKRRVESEDIIINCSKDSEIPKPPPGHRWKEVRHDPTVTWLASWTENVQNQVKYIMLNPSSKLKGEKDWQKYETARRLHSCINKIRSDYKDGWKNKEMRIRQRAVALYFIDRLALRAGNEKDEDQADTVGCCSLRVEHIELHERKDDKEFVVVFDFLGKDSIRYYNEVPVEKRVFKNLQLFMENKQPGDDLFDRLNTSIMNKHLNELMEGLTAKVFRTYNASWTLQQQLAELTNEDDSIAEKILSYNRANRAVAILCNHQRSVPKGHEKSMEKLKEKIDQKRDQIKDAERQVKDAARDAKHGSVKEKTVYDKKKKMLQKMKEQLTKLEIQETDRDENKTIALGTSKLNYLDPRISVAWCKKFGVPIEKIYNKTQRDKFRWAIDMAGPDYHF